MKGLVEAVNQLIRGPLLYQEEPFRQVALSAKTIRLRDEHPQGAALERLNLLLLQDAFPYEMERGESRRELIVPFRCTRTEREAWRNSAAQVGVKQTVWMRSRLNADQEPLIGEADSGSSSGEAERVSQWWSRVAPLGTNTLTAGSSYFSDPAWTNSSTLFYRLR